MRICTILLVGCMCLWGGTVAVRSEEPAGGDLQQKVDRLERELEALKRGLGKNGNGEAAKQGVILLMENGALVPMNPIEPTGARMLVVKLSAANLSGEVQEIAREEMRLLVEGKEQLLSDVPEGMKETGFTWGMENNYLNRVSPFQRLRIPAGGTTSGWVFVPNLPEGTRPLSLELVWTKGGRVQKLDLMGQARNRMDLSVERIGPKGCLGLLTIRGEMSNLGAGVLVNELELLAKDRVSRVVAAWEATASQVEPAMGNWLRMTAEFEDRAHVGELPYPTIPSTIQEFHLSGLPSPDFQPYYRQGEGSPGKPKIHTDASTAVRTALAEILERAPREELLKLIESDHPLGRSAALAVGSGRLLSEDLPVVLKCADAGDVVIQEGALRGLEHFGEPEAVEKLLFWLRKGTEPLSSIAAMSLATSRFPAAQEELLKQLKSETVESQGKLFEFLIRTPRPIIADPLFQFLEQHPEQMKPEFLRGLETVGHPQLIELMERGLKSEQGGVQKEALRILIGRNSDEGDKIALEWTLGFLEKNPPTDQMLLLLKRMKDPRGVEPLLRVLPTINEQQGVITTLGLIADGSIAGRLIGLYPTLPSPSQGEMLTIFKNWEIPEFRELARAALETDDPNKVRSAAVGLIETGGDRGLPWIGSALERTQQPEIVQILAEVLGGLGDADSKEILKKVRGMESRMHRIAAMGALQSIRTRSPGYQVWEQGYGYVSNEMENERNYKEAIRYFDQAIQLDGELFEAHLSRANSLLKLNKIAESKPGFAKALELEPYSGDALTGLCVAQAATGEWEQALERLKQGDADPMFSEDGNFQYNAACVLGRVVTHLQKSSEIPEREKLIEKYSGEAVERLKKSVEMGFGDFPWMEKDPDLESLRGLEGFQKLLKDKGVEGGNADFRAVIPAEGPDAGG